MVVEPQNTESAEGGNIELLKSERLHNSTFLVRYSIFKAEIGSPGMARMLKNL
jgi:hypothetical protein